jgi:hypothetical protein
MSGGKEMYTNRSIWRPVFLVFVGAALLLAASATLAYVDAWREKSAAEQLLVVLSRIQVGSSTETDVTNATEAFSEYADRQLNYGSQKGASWVTYTFQNRVMAFLHLAPWKFAYIGLEFKNGVVVSKSLNFYQQPRSGVIVQEVMAAEGGNSTKINARQIHTIIYGPNRRVIEVHDDTSVSLARRQLDWKTDLSCMTEMASCKDPHRMLPGIDQQ